MMLRDPSFEGVRRVPGAVFGRQILNEQHRSRRHSAIVGAHGLHQGRSETVLPVSEAAGEVCLRGGRGDGQDVDGVGQEIGSDGLEGAAKLGQQVEVAVRLGEIPSDVSEALVEAAELARGPVRRIAGLPDHHDGDLDVGDG